MSTETQPGGQGRARTLVGFSIALLVLSPIMLFAPVQTAGELATWLGLGLLVAAGSQFATTRQMASPRALTGWTWAAVGVFLAQWPDPTLTAIVIVTGAALVVGGVAELRLMRRLPRRSDLRFAAAAGAGTHLLFGAAVWLWPSITLFTVAALAGLWTALLGVRLLVQALDRVRGGAVRSRPRRWSSSARIVGSTAMVLVAVLLVVSAGIARAPRPPDPGPFYATPEAFDPTPGALLRSEVIEPFVDNGTAHRVLYTSQDVEGQPAAASGIVVVPDGPPPADGWPVLAFTHGTIGIARWCAPSLLDGDYAEQMWGLPELLEAGWVVAAPDYLGLGSEGVHPYLVGDTAAAGTLDAVRAASVLTDGATSPRFAVAGHSQGGHAALFTGQTTPTYAPELDLLGVVALAPASDLAAVTEANDGTTFGNVLGSYAITSWSRVFDELDMNDLVDAEVLPVVEGLADRCIAAGPDAVTLLTEAELLQLRFFLAPVWEVEPWASLIADNTPGDVTIEAPLVLIQGADDALILPELQRGFAARLCDGGQQLEYREVAGIGHLGIDDAASELVVEWLGDRLDGVPATSTCG